MGIWDNLKSRLRKPDDLGEAGYDQDYYDEYGNDDAYRDAYGDIYYAEGDSQEYYYGYDDAGYQLEDQGSTAPLVNMADIRSQPIPFNRGVASREDRIPQPVVRERRSSTSVSGLAQNDQEAFRDSLARSSQNSLPQLHSERIQLEANILPEFDIPDQPTASSRRLTGSGGGSSNRSSGSRNYSGPTAQRGQRRIEHLRPQSYADAESISINLRQGAAVVLDLTDVRPELAKRILDFSFGVTSAFEGQVDRYADRIYILTRNSSLSESERNQIRL
jgi:cell division inhibitor SepF